MTKLSPIKPDKSILSGKARPAVYLFRSAACHLYAGAATASGRETITATGAAQRLFSGDVVTESYIRRGASAPATTGDAGWAGALVRDSVFDAIQVATSLSAGASLIANGLKVSLTSGQVIVPGRIVSADAAGMWVREGFAIPVRAPAFSAVVLARRKLCVIAVFTREMTESSNIEAIVRQTLSEASGLALDTAMFSNAPDDGARPAGLLFGIPALPPTAGGGSAAMAADVGKLVAALAANGGGLAPTFVAAAPQAAALKLLAGQKFDASVLASAALPSGTVVAVEASSFVSGFDSTPEFSVSRAGTLHMESATPAPIDGAVPVRDLYQTDCLALKMTLAAAWACRAPHVAWIQNTTW